VTWGARLNKLEERQALAATEVSRCGGKLKNMVFQR